MKKSICLLLIACIGFLTFASHIGEAKTKAPPDVGLVQSFDDVFTVNSADVSQVTEVTHLIVNKYDLNEVLISIIVREEKSFCFIETAILATKTPIFDVLDWPGNCISANYNSIKLLDYNVMHQKPISYLSCSVSNKVG